MAAVAGIRTAHATLVADTQDVVTLSGGARVRAELVNHGTDAIYFRTDGVTVVGAADETEVCLGGERLSINLSDAGTINLISAGDSAYSVVATS